MKNPIDKWALPIILGFYFLLGLAYSVVNPILESPDELLNYENIRFLVDERKLPVLQPGEFSKAHHPPLYYILGAVLTGWVPNEELQNIVNNSNPFWGYRIYDQGLDNKSQYLHNPDLEGFPYRDAVLGIHLLRVISLLLGAGVILVIFLTARALSPEEPFLAWGAAGLAAFNPMFLFIQSSVHNDTLTNFLAALTIFAVVRYWKRGPSVQGAVFLGLTTGLGILTKITFLFLGPVVALALIARSWEDRHDDKGWWRTALKMLLIGGFVVLLLAGWWFVRNQILYGDPTSMKLQASIWQPRENSPDWKAAFNELTFLRDSFWGAFGFGQIPLHRPVYSLLWVIEIIAAVGLGLWAVRSRRRKRFYRAPGLLLAVLLIAPITAFAATFGRMTVSGSANFGRYLFTSYAVLAPLLVLGLTEWVPSRWRRTFMASIVAFFLTLAFYALFAILQPAYAAPPIYNSSENLEITHPREDVYPGLATLLGYGLSSDSAVPGERLDITLFWQVTAETEENYSLFAQLVDGDGRRIAGRDTHAGLGRYPTSRWQAGEIIEDNIPLYIPDDAQGPQGAALNIGLRDDGGSLLQAVSGQDTLTLEIIRLAGSQTNDTIGDSWQYTLGERVQLLSVEGATKTAAAGEELSFSLTWHALEAIGEDYVVFVHLLDEKGALVAPFDHPPMDGNFPTHLWQAGDTVLDKRLIQLPSDLAPGSYSVNVGWYRLEDLLRLPVIDAQGQPLAESAIPIFTFELRQ